MPPHPITTVKIGLKRNGPVHKDRAFYFRQLKEDQTFGANSVAESTFTPGPIVEEIATRLM